MKKTTRLMSLLLTIAMIISLAVPMTVSAAFTDVDTNHNYYEAITNLSAEGILNGFEDGSFKPGDPVTRAQFTKIICFARAVGNITHSEAERSIFTDVAANHWAANNIVTAYKQGIINGMGDGTFAPEANVNYEQAVKMVVCALGYEQRAQSLGGYPYGYLSVANSNKIISGIKDCKIGEAMNRGAVAKLIDNMLNAKQVDEDGEGGSGNGGSIRDEVGTADKVSGRLIAGYGVALYDGTNPCYKNQIQLNIDDDEIDDLFVISEIEDFDINEYIGRYVTVHFETEEGSSDQIVTSIAFQSKKNEETVIDLDMIHDYDTSSIEYYVDDSRDETETVYFDTDSMNLFNGEYTKKTVDELLDDNYKKSGQITLLATTTDDSADVVIMKAYDLLVVSHTDKTKKIIYGLNEPFKKGITVDVESKTQNATITKAGKAYSFSSIKLNNVLSVAKSESGNVVEVLVADKANKAGTVISIEENGTQIILDSGSTKYTLLNNYRTEYGTKEDLAPGKHVTIAFDAFGKVAIVYFTTEKSFDYGYLSAINYSDEEEEKAEMSVRLYKAASSNSTLSYLEYYLADRVEINGESKKLEDDLQDIVDFLVLEAAKAKPEGVKAEKDSIAQPIRYSVDTTGKIKSLSTWSNKDTQDTSKLIIKPYSKDGVKCEMTGSKLGTYSIDSSTKIIYVPENRASGTYQTKSSSFFKKGTSYYVHLANVSSTGLVKCIYVYGVANGSGGTSTDIYAQITEDTMPLIVKSVSGVNLDNSDKKIVLVDVTTGEEFTYYDNDIAEAQTLSAGDIVRVATTERVVSPENGGNGENYTFISIVQVLADAEDVVAGTFATLEKTDGEGSGIDYDFRTLIGTVTAKNEWEKRFTIVKGYSTSGDPESYGISDSAKIYMVDTTEELKNRVTSAASEDFDAGKEGISSRIMIYTNKANVQAIIIFK